MHDLYRVSDEDSASSLVPVHMESVTCDGTESEVTDCTFTLSTDNNHMSDVYLVCWPNRGVYNGMEYVRGCCVHWDCLFHNIRQCCTCVVVSINLEGTNMYLDQEVAC